MASIRPEIGLLDGVRAVIVCAPLPYTLDRLESRSMAAFARSSPLATVAAA